MLLIPMANLKVMKRNINLGTSTNLQVLEESQGRSHGNCQGLHRHFDGRETVLPPAHGQVNDIISHHVS